jgi:hypothetical protein
LRPGCPEVAVEGGAAWQTRNDFRIPGDGGTLVRLGDYDSGPAAAFRATLRWDLTERQSLRLLVAPLRLDTTFVPAEPVVFQELVFPAEQRRSRIRGKLDAAAAPARFPKRPPMDPHQKKQAQFSGAYILLAFAALLLVQAVIARSTAPRSVPMSELVEKVREG